MITVVAPAFADWGDIGVIHGHQASDDFWQWQKCSPPWALINHTICALSQYMNKKNISVIKDNIIKIRELARKKNIQAVIKHKNYTGAH